jgi:hypothetical protein
VHFERGAIPVDLDIPRNHEHFAWYHGSVLRRWADAR